MKKRYTKGARHPHRIDTGPVGRLPYRLLVGGGGAERTIKGDLLPVLPLRVATRIATVGVGTAIVKRLTTGRITRMRVRKLAWDATSRMWFLILDF